MNDLIQRLRTDPCFDNTTLGNEAADALEKQQAEIERLKTVLSGFPAFSESQLRSEVERVRRETVEECARVCIDLHANDQTNILYAAKVIKEIK